MTEEQYVRRPTPLWRRILLAYDGLVTLLALASVVWVARGCWDERASDFESVPDRLYAVELGADSAKMVRDSLKAQLTTIEKKLDARLDSVDLRLNFIFCEGQPPPAVQLFAKVNCSDSKMVDDGEE